MIACSSYWINIPKPQNQNYSYSTLKSSRDNSISSSVGCLECGTCAIEAMMQHYYVADANMRYERFIDVSDVISLSEWKQHSIIVAHMINYCTIISTSAATRWQLKEQDRVTWLHQHDDMVPSRTVTRWQTGWQTHAARIQIHAGFRIPRWSDLLYLHVLRECVSVKKINWITEGLITWNSYLIMDKAYYSELLNFTDRS